MAKPVPKITEWRIIGVSGSTVDGREISAQELKEMAENYDPEIYGARINLEHMRFLWDSYAGGYGDVVELKTEKWEKDTNKTALWAKLSVLPALQEVWDGGEKLYTSMEIQSNFADTGKAYLVGLAITDSPASLGTTQNFSLNAQKAEESNIKFSEYKELEVSQMQKKAEPLTEDKAENLFTKLLNQWFGKPNEPKSTDDVQTDEHQANDYYAAQIAELRQANEDAAKLHEATIGELNELKQQFADLKYKLETEPASGERTPHGGANEIGKAAW